MDGNTLMSIYLYGICTLAAIGLIVTAFGSSSR